MVNADNYDEVRIVAKVIKDSLLLTISQETGKDIAIMMTAQEAVALMADINAGLNR